MRSGCSKVPAVDRAPRRRKRTSGSVAPGRSELQRRVARLVEQSTGTGAPARRPRARPPLRPVPRPPRAQAALRGIPQPRLQQPPRGLRVALITGAQQQLEGRGQPALTHCGPRPGLSAGRAAPAHPDTARRRPSAGPRAYCVPTVRGARSARLCPARARGEARLNSPHRGGEPSEGGRGVSEAQAASAAGRREFGFEFRRPLGVLLAAPETSCPVRRSGGSPALLTLRAPDPFDPKSETTASERPVARAADPRHPALAWRL